MKQNNSGRIQRNMGFGNTSRSVVCRVWCVVVKAVESWGTGYVLGQCGNEFCVSTNSGGVSGGAVQDSLLHECTRVDSFHFIGVLLLFVIG